MLLALPLARDGRRRLLRINHLPAPPDPTPVSRSLLAPIAVFAAALYGHRLEERDQTSLENDLEFLLQDDAGWRPEFAQAAAYLDRRSQAEANLNFAEAPDPVRAGVVDALMRGRVEDRRSKLLALVSGDERVRRRVRAALVPALAIVYRGSAAAWRQRGYDRRPGFPGDPTDYTRAGTPSPC